MNVGTSPVSIGTASYLIQNLGPGDIYVGESTVTTTNGVRVSPGEALAVGATNSAIHVVSESTSDVRTLGRGTGIFAAEVPTP